MYTVYIIKSLSKNSYYVGVTSNIKQRIRHHNSGANVSTKKRGPWILIWTEEFSDKRSAWLREKQIKKYKSGEAFKKLINNGGFA